MCVYVCVGVINFNLPSVYIQCSRSFVWLLDQHALRIANVHLLERIQTVITCTLVVAILLDMIEGTSNPLVTGQAVQHHAVTDIESNPDFILIEIIKDRRSDSSSGFGGWKQPWDCPSLNHSLTTRQSDNDWMLSHVQVASELMLLLL